MGHGVLFGKSITRSGRLIFRVSNLRRKLLLPIQRKIISKRLLDKPLPPLHIRGERRSNRPWPIAPERRADRLDPPDQVQHLPPAVRAACRLAEMRPASERTIRVNQTPAGPGLEHWAGAIGRLWKPGAAGGAERFDRQHRFGVREPRGGAGQAELAALRPPDAIALDRTRGEIGIDLAHGIDGGSGAFISWSMWVRAFWALACGVFGHYFQSIGECASDSPCKMDRFQTLRRSSSTGRVPSGLAMACELARHGIPVRIFDRNSEASPQSRALAIFPRTLEVFSAIGILDEVLAEGRRLEAVSLYNDARRLARMNFENIDSPYRFAIALPQSRTERLIEARLGALGVRSSDGWN